MDVHGPKLVRPLFTIATAWNAASLNKSLQAVPTRRDSQDLDACIS